jgi:hypothetical protein
LLGLSLRFYGFGQNAVSGIYVVSLALSGEKPHREGRGYDKEWFKMESDLSNLSRVGDLSAFGSYEWNPKKIRGALPTRAPIPVFRLFHDLRQ